MKHARRPLRPRAGMTLIEVLVSATIVGLLALVLLAANVPLSRASSEMGVAFDMDRNAGRLLTDLRREVRQSGYNQNALQLTLANGVDGGPSTLGPFRRRVSFGDLVDDTTSSNWSRTITYSLAASGLGNYADGTPRYVLRRAQAGSATTPVLDHVAALSFATVLGPGGDQASLTVSLTLRRENPGWSGTGEGRFVVRTYGEDIEFLNRKPEAP